MDYLPLFFDLRQRWCVLAGGGQVALRKAKLLARAGAKLAVIAPEVLPELQELARSTGGTFDLRNTEENDLEGCNLLILATNDSALNAHLANTAHKRRIPVNVTDDPAQCSVILPAIVDRAPILVAISSGANAPVIVRRLRERLEAELPADLGRVARFFGKYRKRLCTFLSDTDSRRRFWERALDGPVTEMILSGRLNEARSWMERELTGAGVAPSRGEVWLVGAGPGDPDLLTLRALRLLQSADVVVYDRLVNAEILDLARREAKRVYVGKRPGDHVISQEEITALLVNLAKDGKRVLRLKGGDPFLFGRGGEEIQSLNREGIPFQVVPGISAASGCAAYAGIPLTHRDHAQSVCFVTGHVKDGNVDLDWPRLAQSKQTLVVFMGVAGLKQITDKLQFDGIPADRPAAVIENGTRRNQRVFTATIGEIAQVAGREQVQAPALLIIGDVVTLREKLRWHATSHSIYDKVL